MTWVTNIYLYKENLVEGKPMLCIRCGKKWGVVNRAIYAITNSSGQVLKELPPSTGYFEHKCRGCEMMYRLYFQ